MEILVAIHARVKHVMLSAVRWTDITCLFAHAPHIQLRHDEKQDQEDRHSDVHSVQDVGGELDEALGP